MLGCAKKNRCEEREANPEKLKPCRILSREWDFRPSSRINHLQGVSDRVCWLKEAKVGLIGSGAGTNSGTGGESSDITTLPLMLLVATRYRRDRQHNLMSETTSVPRGVAPAPSGVSLQRPRRGSTLPRMVLGLALAFLEFVCLALGA